MFLRLWNLLWQRPGLFFLFLLLSPVYLPLILFGELKRRYWGPHYDDPQFGRFLKEADLDFFDVPVSWNGKRSRLVVPALDDQPHPQALERARTLWVDEAGWHERATDCVLDELFDLWTSNWRKEHQRRLTPEEFRACLTIDSICPEEDGSVELWYFDGGLFLGHSVVVDIDADDQMKSAHLAG